MFIRLSKMIPQVRNKVEGQLETEATKNVTEMLKHKKIKGQFSKLPEKGLEYDKIMEILDQRIAADVNPTAGKTFAYVYECSKKHNKVT